MTLHHGEPAIITNDLCKRFTRPRDLASLLLHPRRSPQRVTALDQINLEVRRGEVFGLLGPNGAGKTTLLKILACLVLPDSGSAMINGYSITGNEMAVKRSIGYVTSDERSFYWRLTGAQNLAFFARLFHIPSGEISSLVRRLLARVELVEKADAPFSSYSSGMKQRLSMARALLHDPPILYLDEPTRSLDPVTARHIRLFIRDHLARVEKKTVFLATHNLHEAADLCHRMAILSRARVHRIGRLEEFRSLFSAGRRYRLITDRPVDLSGIARVIEENGEKNASRGASGAGSVSVLLELTQKEDGSLSALVARLAASGTRVLELARQERSLEDLFEQIFRDAECPA
ncbi:MAG: ABC transporter ATP-binding protein [Acidobacteriota bacterium]